MTTAEPMRAFVALEIPPEVGDQIGRARHSLQAALPRARWTRPGGQHLTLKFLGATPGEVVPKLAAAIAAGVAGLATVKVRLGGAGFFPSPRRPRVAWVGGSAEGGTEVAAAVESAAVDLGWSPEPRPWSLHLTQARLDRPWPRTAVESFLNWGRGLELPVFECPEVVLFSSELRPGGAVYTALERFPLA